MPRALVVLAFVASLSACATEPRARAPQPGATVVEETPRRRVTTRDMRDMPDKRDTHDPRDTNPPGTTLLRSSVFVDPAPPDDWKQCAGFVNTEEDDVTADFLDNCLYAERLRVRVFDSRGELEEDVYVSGLVDLVTWPENYLGTQSTVVKATHWGTKGGVPSVLTSNLSECFPAAWPKGTTLGSGHATTAIIAGAADGADEYRVSCGTKQGLPGRKIAVYR